MSVPEFLFALELSDHTAHDRMIADVANAVCAYAGLGKNPPADVIDALRSALAQRLGRCDVRFVGHAGQFEIIVSDGSGNEWRTSRTVS